MCVGSPGVQATNQKNCRRLFRASGVEGTDTTPEAIFVEEDNNCQKWNRYTLAAKSTCLRPSSICRTSKQKPSYRIHVVVQDEVSSISVDRVENSLLQTIVETNAKLLTLRCYTRRSRVMQGTCHNRKAPRTAADGRATQAQNASCDVASPDGP